MKLYIKSYKVTVPQADNKEYEGTKYSILTDIVVPEKLEDELFDGFHNLGIDYSTIHGNTDLQGEGDCCWYEFVLSEKATEETVGRVFCDLFCH